MGPVSISCVATITARRYFTDNKAKSTFIEELKSNRTAFLAVLAFLQGH